MNEAGVDELGEGVKEHIYLGLSAFVSFVLLLSIAFVGGCASPPPVPPPTGPATILVTNNSSIAVSMQMNSGGYINIPASGNHVFTINQTGSPTFTTQGISGVAINNCVSAASCGAPYTCTSSALSLDTQYAINITNSIGTCSYCGGTTILNWSCP